jgi:hypothetical protein
MYILILLQEEKRKDSRRLRRDIGRKIRKANKERDK